jgi:hypothetical protein
MTQAFYIAHAEATRDPGNTAKALSIVDMSIARAKDAEDWDAVLNWRRVRARIKRLMPVSGPVIEGVFRRNDPPRALGH